MNRRDTLKSVGLFVGGAVIGADLLLSGCSFFEEEVGILSKDQMAMLEEIVETILPKTAKSPGAKEAEIGVPINNIVTRFYSLAEQQALMEGLEVYKVNKFLELTLAQRETYLLEVEKDAELNPVIAVTDKEGKTTETISSYKMIRQLSLWGYMSSEIIAKSVFNYLSIPGTYDGCVTVTNEVKPMYPDQRFGTKINNKIPFIES